MKLKAHTKDAHLKLGIPVAIPVAIEGTLNSSQIEGALNGGKKTLAVSIGRESIHLPRILSQRP